MVCARMHMCAKVIYRGHDGIRRVKNTFKFRWPYKVPADGIYTKADLLKDFNRVYCWSPLALISSEHLTAPKYKKNIPPS